MSQLDLDPRDIARTQQPVERATMLPPAAFVDQGVFEWELDEIFRGWVVAAHVSAVNEPGKFLVRQVGTDSVVIMGGADGAPHAFLNVCRHRGARLVEEPEGQVRKRLRCPYHAWSYDLDGELRAAPHMDGVEDFERPRPHRPLGRGARARRARRRPARSPRSLPRPRPAARR
jgi:Rieske 2Fe-2S family protein